MPVSDTVRTASLSSELKETETRRPGGYIYGVVAEIVDYAAQ